MTAELALGTYRVRAVEPAARTACSAGAPWVDTAPNYLQGRAHKELAPALGDYLSVRIATKTGFYTSDQGRDAVAAGVLAAEDAHLGHSLAPAFVRWQAERSLTELKRADMVFVHNPERVGNDPPHVQEQIRGAFAALEDLSASGRIGGYGVATWEGLRTGLFTVADLVRLAEEAAGSPDHHLAGLQLPVSLVMVDPITQALDGGGPLIRAKEAGLTTFASAPLHGGELPGFMTPELVDLIRPGLSAPAAAMLAVASCPGLDVVLVSASTSGHWNDVAQALSTPLPPARLRSVVDALAAG